MTESKPSTKKRISCAECRRLKLKCDRVWPCSSCQKRGVAEICPEGSLATRSRRKPDFKPFSPAPQRMLQYIYELQMRTHELENALSTLQATISTESHPLLKSNSQSPHLQTSDASTSSQGGTKESDTGDQDDIIEALGTLNIAPDGRSRFYGPTAVSEGLSIEKEPIYSQKIPNVSLPADIAALAWAYFPFAGLPDAVKPVLDCVNSYLPPLGRAKTLCNSYFTHVGSVTMIVPQDEWFENLFYRVYGKRRDSEQSPDDYPEDDGQDDKWASFPRDELSVFFSILALGALTDISTEPFNSEAETYYQLSRALLKRDNVLGEPTLASVQCLFLGSYHEAMRSQGSGTRDSWILIAATSKTGQIIGLHRDHSTFGLDQQEIHRRRVLFWETYSLDMMQSLELGRPFSIAIAYTDTQMPANTFGSDVDSKTGEVKESFYQWKYRFCAEVGSVVSDHVLRVKPPSYASALEADRTLRRFTTTFGRGLPKTGNWTDPMAAVQYQMMIGIRETYMLYIHRVFFAHAVSSRPIDPEKSKYSMSVTTAYESACRIVEGMRIFVHHHPAFAARVWFLWNHILSASFVLGSIVVHSPGSSLAAPASVQLETIYEMLKQESVYRGRAEYMLPIIGILRSKGYNAQVKYRAEFMMDPQSKPSPGSIGEEYHDELAVIGGKARVVLSGPSRHSSISLPRSSIPHQTTNMENYQAPDTFLQKNQNEYSVYSDTTAQNTDWVQDAPEQFSHAPPEFNFVDPLESFSQHLSSMDNYPGVNEIWPDAGNTLWQTLVRDLSER